VLQLSTAVCIAFLSSAMPSPIAPNHSGYPSFIFQFPDKVTFNILTYLLDDSILVPLPITFPLLKLPPSNYKTQFSGIFILASFKS
jgi:hypothetical protein